MSLEADFRDALWEAGLDYKGEIVADGRLHRFKSGPDKNPNSWYVLHADHPPAGAFGCKKRGIEEKWKQDGPAPTAAERAEQRARIDADRRRRAEEETARQTAARAEARSMLDSGRDATDDHPYLTRKGVRAHPGLCSGRWRKGKRTISNCLLIPLGDTSGTLTTVQAIFPARDEAMGRDKDLIQGGKKSGSFFAIGDLATADTILIAEGYATAATLHEATFHAAVMAVDAGNLRAVTEALAKRYPAAQRIVCGDSDPVGTAKATDAALDTASLLAIPNFAEGEQGTDFNDLATLHGLERVRQEIEQVITASLTTTRQEDATQPQDTDMTTPTPVADIETARQKKATKAPKSEKAKVERATKAPKSEMAQGHVIRVQAGRRIDMMREAEDALIEAGTVYHNSAGMLVRIARTGESESGETVKDGVRFKDGSLVVMPATPAWLTTEMDRTAAWKRVKKVDGELTETDCDAPAEIARYYAEQVGAWRLPYLAGTIECPTLRRDGTILERPGYDPATHMYFDAGSTDFAPISRSPTKADAADAIEMIADVVKDFPFADLQDRSVFLSGVLTVIVRHMLRDSPLHGFSASRPRSGKTYQADIASLIATGRPAPAMSATQDGGEEEKRLVSILLSGTPIALIDNIDEPLRSPRLCMAITGEVYKGRLLGVNHMPNFTTRLTWFVTGNNLRLHDDLNPRALCGYLIPTTDRPEEREFDRDLKAYTLSVRHLLAPAAVTILKAYLNAGEPSMGLKGFGAAPDWSALVRSALVWLEQADPVLTQERLRSSDPAATALACLLEAWHKAHGSGKMTTAEIVNTADQHPNLAEALKEVSSKDGDKINTKKLGNYFASIADRIEAGYALKVSGVSHQAKLWSVEKKG